MKLVASLSLLVLVGQALGGITRLMTEVSTDGRNWTQDLTALPGAKVQIRITTSFVGSEQVYGFSNINLQPTIENWADGDTVAPYVRTGNLTSGSFARDKPRPGENAYGRMYHFAGPGFSGINSPLTEHLHTINGRQYLRIAQSRTTNWIGAGPTSGTAAVNNFNGAGGIPLSQLSPGFAQSPITPNFDIEEVVLFKFMITLDPELTDRWLVVDTPAAGCSLIQGVRSGSWFTTPSLSPSSFLRAPVESWASVINVRGPVPSPAVATVLALSATMPVRRRRSS